MGLGGNGLAGTTVQTEAHFLPTRFPLRGQHGCGKAGAGRAGVTYQFWLSSYGFHTKILTLLRGATGHSTFPSRLRVMLALAALSGRECHPGWSPRAQTSSHGRGRRSGEETETGFLTEAEAGGLTANVSASPGSTSPQRARGRFTAAVGLHEAAFANPARSSAPCRLPPPGRCRRRDGAPTPAAPTLLTRGRHWLPPSLMLRTSVQTPM